MRSLSLDRDWRKVKYLPLYGYAVQDMNFSWVRGLGAFSLESHPREHRFQGFEPRERAWNEDFARFRQSRPNGVQFEIDPDGLRDFEELVASAHALGVPVLLVYSPVYFEMTKAGTRPRRNVRDVPSHC